MAPLEIPSVSQLGSMKPEVWHHAVKVASGPSGNRVSQPSATIAGGKPGCAGCSKGKAPKTRPPKKYWPQENLPASEPQARSPGPAPNSSACAGTFLQTGVPTERAPCSPHSPPSVSSLDLLLVRFFRRWRCPVASGAAPPLPGSRHRCSAAPRPQ